MHQRRETLARVGPVLTRADDALDAASRRDVGAGICRYYSRNSGSSVSSSTLAGLQIVFGALMDVGCRLRLINDPGRVGVFTGQTSVLGGRDYVQVAFPDQTMRVPLDQVELVDERGESPIDLLRRGRLARPTDLYRTLTHIRLAGRLANFIYSLETTDTDFYAYQFKPVLKLLQSSTTGILVADEVGLGKTIEAGLVWTELRSRFDLQRLLMICPAMLRDKWKRELQRRFGVTARICGADELVETLGGVRSGEIRDYAVVASLQGLRPPPNWDESEVSGPRVQLARLLSESAQESPLIDLLIIDEAHYLKNPETRTFELGSLLRRSAQFAVLLSATPVHLHSDDLFHLLRIVDEDVFNQRDVFEFIRQANERLLTVRDLVLAGTVDATALQDHLTAILTHPLLKGNRQLAQLLEALDTFGDLRQPRVRVDIASRLEAANLFGLISTISSRASVVAEGERGSEKDPYVDKRPLIRPIADCAGSAAARPGDAVHTDRGVRDVPVDRLASQCRHADRKRAAARGRAPA